jgi:uncharacterized repeat protein (TIGR01451 family)
MIAKLSKTIALAFILASGMQPAAAQDTGLLTSKVELEKPGSGVDGREGAKIYTTPDVVVPGDRVRLTLTFANNGAAPAGNMIVMNPIPGALVFDGTNDTAGCSVSVNGGMTFGALGELKVAVADAAPRPAVASEVTHVRWTWPDAIAPGESRSVAFFGRVQ